MRAGTVALAAMVQLFCAAVWPPRGGEGSVVETKVARSTVQFALRCDAPSGGALKLRHYFEHALASRISGHVALYMPADTRWSAANTWTRHRDRVTDDIDWPTVRVVVISGWGWDRFIPQRFHKAPPFRVVYLVQSFGRIDPRDSQFRHLANPAIRICVSGPLEAEELGGRRVGSPERPDSYNPGGYRQERLPGALQTGHPFAHRRLQDACHCARPSRVAYRVRNGRNHADGEGSKR